MFGFSIPPWMLGAGIFGTLAACWGQVKSVLARLASLFVVHITIDGYMQYAVSSYCWRRFRRSPFGFKEYGAMTSYVRPVRREQVVGYEAIGESATIFWRGVIPLIVGSPAHGNETEARRSSSNRKMTLTFIRGTFNTDKLLVDAVDDLNRTRSTFALGCRSRFKVEHVFGRHKKRGRYDDDEPEMAYGEEPHGENMLLNGQFRVLKWGLDDLGPDRPMDGKTSMHYLAFPPEVSGLIDEARRWLDSEDWYRRRGIPWRRGWTLYGKPGTGKTSLVRALAEELDLPIWVFDLSTLSNEELLRSWKRMMTTAPCIALIEDLDAIFEGRENMYKEHSTLTFDAVLNCLDGIDRSNGCFVVMTTNNIDKLDPALGIPCKDHADAVSTRPGRIDRVMELREMDERCRRLLAERILSECPEYVDDLVAKGQGDTGAQFQERCARAALAWHWEHKEKSDGQ